MSRTSKGPPAGADLSGHADQLDAICSPDSTDRPGEQRRIDEIRVGRRHRRDLGDIDALAASIADVGLLHPIVITPNGTLIAGEHRLEARAALAAAGVVDHSIDQTAGSGPG